MRKILRGWFVGLILGAAIGFVLGYNHGRGAAWLSNPFQPRTLDQRAHDAGQKALDSARQGVDKLDRKLDGKN
ncbi:MAG TPA: hypothetical protein VFA86_01880 [Gammaproteobacteria bacterium]|nr:hypothetical protein [Gammaproteobacteria bacterium]